MPLQLSFGLGCAGNGAPFKDYLEFVTAGEDLGATTFPFQ
jgi:hypothetical protein